MFCCLYILVFNYEQSDKKVQRDLKLIIFVMVALIFIVSKRRWFYWSHQKLKKKLESDKYPLCKVFFKLYLSFMRTIKYDNIICFITFLFL